ncbi:hypothetical protein NDU88_001789 [Pleurodeles waltl]|uniref:Uncharacterized protein n=1 Tax=Pleurodeles waltl TaxID=8319 RepID=A0AAV7UXP7_PLEWA|nr:hypothetical protein NDU88_001789 [Pleurodeles waltl]
MLVGSLLPLRQRSIGREGGGRRRPGRLPAPGVADVPLSRRSALCPEASKRYLQRATEQETVPPPLMMREQPGSE